MSVSAVSRSLAAVFLVTFLAFPAQARGPVSVADIAAPLLDAVVNISTSQTIEGVHGPSPSPKAPGDVPFQEYFDDFLGDPDAPPDDEPQRVQSLGSGFVIDPSGIIITNNHVIEDADEITVNFNDGTSLKATLKGYDEKTDLAVLEVKPDAPLTSVKFGDSDKLRVGDWVMAIGNPFGLGGTLTVGIVSARNRDINAGPYDDFIQTDAAINRGNSGGPLFNMDGEVVGINTAIISPTGGSIGIGFSVPASIAIKVIDQLRRFGETRRGWLGVRIRTLTEDVAADLGMKGKPRGALVGSVDEKGPAAEAGVRAGDVVLSVDGQMVDPHHSLQRLIADEPVGKQVSIVLLRDGKEQTVTVTLGRLEDAEKAAQAPETPSPAPPPAEKPETSAPAGEKAPFGLTLAALTPELRKSFELADDVGGGVVVTAVAPGSAAEDARLQPGDVISMAGNEAVATPQDFNDRIDAMKGEGRGYAQLVVQNKDGVVRFVNLALK